MKVSPFMALMMSFASWLGIGVFLLYKGLKILVGLVHADAASSLTNVLASWIGSLEHVILFGIAVSLMIGFIKGRFVLSKTVGRLTERFFSFSRPMHIKEVYPMSYIILICSMMFLGMSMKWIPLPLEIKGFMDVAVGSALINGAMQYFRVAFSKEKDIAVK